MPPAQAPRVVYGEHWAARLWAALDAAPTLSGDSAAAGTGTAFGAGAAIDAWMRRSTLLHKSDERAAAGLLTLDGQACFLKYYRPRPDRGRMRPALRALRAARRLAPAGVPVAQPLCCLTLGSAVFLLSEHLGSDDYSRLWQRPPDTESAALYLRAAGSTLGRLHTLGYSHGDCKWNNLMWSRGRCYLVDLDAVRRPGLFADRRRARDVARFIVAAEEAGVEPAQLRLFLHSYLTVRSGCRESSLRRHMRSRLRSLRRRHARRYGIVPRPLL